MEQRIGLMLRFEGVLGEQFERAPGIAALNFDRRKVFNQPIILRPALERALQRLARRASVSGLEQRQAEIAKRGKMARVGRDGRTPCDDRLVASRPTVKDLAEQAGGVRILRLDI